MEIKENVYLQNSGTEQEDIMKTGAKTRENEKENPKESGSAVLTKFKDVDALKKAYSALEAEFTRRSQKLKELERVLENSEKENADKGVGNGAFGVEKLKKAQALKAEEKRKFDRFVSDLEGGRKTEPKVSGDEGENAMEYAGNAEKAGNAEDAENAENTARLEEKSSSSKLEEIVDERLKDTMKNADFTVQNATVEKEKETEKVVANLRENDGTALENLYRQATENEQVRLRIIGEYLQSIGKGAPLMKGGVGATLAPPLKAKSFAEAGTMALRLFKGER